MRLLRTFEKVTNTTVPFEILERRLGDIDAIYAKCELAETELGWKSKYSLEQMCKCIVCKKTVSSSDSRIVLQARTSGAGKP
jgi:UDP-glucose 4-epimerase